VRDANGQQLTYVYFEDGPGRRSVATLLERDEARQIAFNITKLPMLLGRHQTWKCDEGIGGTHTAKPSAIRKPAALPFSPTMPG